MSEQNISESVTLTNLPSGFTINENMSETSGKEPESTSKDTREIVVSTAVTSSEDTKHLFKSSQESVNERTVGNDLSTAEVTPVTRAVSLSSFTSSAGNKFNIIGKVVPLENSNPLKLSCEEATNELREVDTKSPEMILEEVQEEVIKLNISSEEPKTNKHREEPQSSVVVNGQNDSLRSLMVYSGDSDSEHSVTELQVKSEGVTECRKSNENQPRTRRPWRGNQVDNSGSTDSESDSSSSTWTSESESDSENSENMFKSSDGDSVSVIDASDDGIRTESPVLNKNSDKGAVKKTGKAILDFPEYLPPIPDLSKLNINAEVEFMHIGRITAIIAELVTIEAIPGSPAFDLDSMLFIDDQTSKKPIGPIFDVLGPVSEPIYCVRFNNEDEIQNLRIKIGMMVYAAPKSEEFTKFVFVKELMKMKGTDASWLNDQEQPVEMAESSDDDEDHQAKRSDKQSAKRKLDDSSLERHKRYEKTMNQCNTLNTRVCRLMDAHKNISKQKRPNAVEELTPPGCEQSPMHPPSFNPTVPPPGFGHPSPYGYPSQGTLFAPSPSSFGQPPNFHGLAYNPQNVSYGTQAVFSGPAQFGSFYANQPPSPQCMGPPPARWQRCDNFRRGRHSQRTGLRQNSDNYFTNNSRNYRGAGPSSQPF